MSENYSVGLNQCPANYQALTPLSFLHRAVQVYPDKIAVIHGEERYTYRQFATRCRSLAASLAAQGMGRGSTVSIMAPNTPAHLEAHFAVPMTGADSTGWASAQVQRDLMKIGTHQKVLFKSDQEFGLVDLLKCIAKERSGETIIESAPRDDSAGNGLIQAA